MNEWNPLEKQLQSWTPRRPSADIERRLFSRQSRSVASQRPVRVSGWFWLAPAMCLFLLVASAGVTRREELRPGAAAGGSNMLACISQNYGAEDGRCRENVWKAVTFDWTKGGSSLSITGSFPSLKTLLRTNIEKL
jgi:hypothetical protein